MEFVRHLCEVIPYIYSVDAGGNEYNFLAITIAPPRSWLQTSSVKAISGVPRHAGNGFWLQLVRYGSSEEQQSGRQVFMDFNRNPEAVRVTCPSH